MKVSKWTPTCEKLLHVQCVSFINVEPDHHVSVCFLSEDDQTLNFTQNLHHCSVFLHWCVSPGCSGWLQEKLNSENKSRTSDSPHEDRTLNLCSWPTERLTALGRTPTAWTLTCPEMHSVSTRSSSSLCWYSNTWPPFTATCRTRAGSSTPFEIWSQWEDVCGINSLHSVSL